MTPNDNQKRSLRSIVEAVGLSVLALILVGYIGFFALAPDPVDIYRPIQPSKPSTLTPEPASPAQTREPVAPAPEVPTYTRVSTEDVSYGIVRRLSVRVSLPKHYTRREIEAISRAITADITNEQSVNAVMIYYHGPDFSTEGVPDVARVEWAPNGRWGDAGDVRTGDYRTFRYNVSYNQPAPEPEPADRTLSRSNAKGLLGTPLPVGARLISRTPGTGARDPLEKYEITASAAEIRLYFDREMLKDGWKKSTPYTSTALFFERGNALLAITFNVSGGSFTLLGS